MSADTTLRLEDIQQFVNISQVNDPVTINQSMLDTDFDDIGVDSLALMELCDRIQEAYQLPIDDDAVRTLHTPQKLLDHVNYRLEQRGS